jgi:hypothetical protein
MRKPLDIIVIVVALFLLAGGLRLFRLGHFPFARDETNTIAEARLLFEQNDGPLTGQYDRLPRLIPVAYFIHAVDYRLFGSDEFGSRVAMAVLGTAGVVILFLGLAPVLGRLTATTTALLLAAWPDHIFRSQENRFYITAWFFAAICMVLGAQAVQRRSAMRMFWSCAAAVAAVLSHTILVLLLPGLFVGTCAAAWCERRLLPWLTLTVVVVFGLATLGLLVTYLIPLAAGWNADDSAWGYGLVHSAFGSVKLVGWSSFLLACLGAMRIVRGHPAQGAYWLTWAAVFVMASVFLPLFVVYHPGYAFSLSTGVVVLAGYGVADLANALRPVGRLWAYSFVAFCVALQFPELASHYMDGSRPDYRTAARYISEHWEPGDRLAAVAPGLVLCYAPLDGPVIRLSGNYLPSLSTAAGQPGRLWIVIPSGRSDKPEEVRRWVGRHCSQELVVRKPRFDYYDHIVEVFLHRPTVELGATMELLNSATIQREY